MTKIKYDGSDDVTVTGRGVVLGGVAVLLAGAVVFGGWEAGWWFKAQNVNRSAAINRQSLGFQQARVDELTRKYSDYKSDKATASDPSLAPDDAARYNKQADAVMDVICQDYKQLTPSYKATLDPNDLTVFDQNCR